MLLLLILELSRQLSHAGFVFREYRVHGKIDIAVGADAAELLGDVVDYGLAAVVEFGLTQVPRLVVSDH